MDNLFCIAAREYRLEFKHKDWEQMNNQLNKMEHSNGISRAIMADKFIEIANEFTKSESKERVSAAIMFAAARYNAFEASSKSQDLKKDRSDALEWYANEYKKMLDANIDELIEMQ